MPTFRSALSSPGFHANIETSVSSSMLTRDLYCNLHRHVAALSTEQCDVGNLCSGGKLAEKTRVPGKEREMFVGASQQIIFLGVHLGLVA